MSTRNELRPKPRRFSNAGSYIALLRPLAGTLAMPRAQAATQEFRGCVNVEDTLDSPEIPLLSGVAGIPIEVEYEALGIFLPGIGSLTTDSGGCFSATLSGFTVPKETRIRLTAKLKDSRQGGANDGGDTYRIDLDTRSLEEGTREEFGDIDFTLANSSDATHGAILMWHAVNRAVDTYQAGVGTWDFSNRLWIYFPADQDTATGGDNGLRIPLAKRDSLSGTFFHELGHFISDSDVFRDGAEDDYCAVKNAGVYPADRSPYTYRNEDEQVPNADCGHSFGSYEHQNRAVAEGFADAVSDFLADGVCQNGKGVAQLGFDKYNSELNVMKFVCRAIDSGEHQSSGLHIYGGNESHLKVLEGASYSAMPYIDGDRIYVAEDKKLHQLDFREAFSTGRPSPELVYRFVSPQVSRVNELFRLGSALCALVSTDSMRKEIYCRAGFFSKARTAGVSAKVAELSKTPPSFAGAGGSPGPVSSSMPATAFESKDSLSPPVVLLSEAFLALDSGSLPRDPSTGAYLLDSYVLSDRIYLLYREASSGGALLSAYSAGLPSDATPAGLERESWTQHFSIQIGNASFSQLAVDSAGSRVFVSTTNAVYTCSLTRGGSTLRLWAGTLNQVGYRRSTRLNSLLGVIGNLLVSGEDLYIADHRGVSRIGFGSAAVDEVVQVVGGDEDPVFENNLSLRSLQYFVSAAFAGGFTLNDEWLVASGSYSRFNEKRGADDLEEALFMADRSIPVVSQVYCGTENVSASARKVLRLYQSAPQFYMSASEFETAFKSATGVSSSDVSALKKHSWLSLGSTGCTLQGGDKLDYEVTAGAARYPEGKLGAASSPIDVADMGKLLQEQQSRAAELRASELSEILKRLTASKERAARGCGVSNIKHELSREDAILKTPLKRALRPGVPEKKFRRPERRFSKPTPLLEAASGTKKTSLQRR